MPSNRAFIILFAIGVAVASLPGSARGASEMWEEELRQICVDSGQTKLPKNLTIHHVIDDGYFLSELRPVVFVSAFYLFRLDLNKGKVIATGVVLKQDGSQVALPRVASKMRSGIADKGKTVSIQFEPGDIIEWKVKMKGLPAVRAGECWTLELGIKSTEATSVASRLQSLLAVTKP